MHSDFDIKALGSQIEKSYPVLWCRVQRLAHDETSSPIFNDRDSERYEIMKVVGCNECVRVALLAIDIQFPHIPAHCLASLVGILIYDALP